jgi:hypothetical protein
MRNSKGLFFKPLLLNKAHEELEKSDRKKVLISKIVFNKN